MQLAEQIKEVILRNMEYKKEIEIVPGTNLVKDLELDSIGIANLLADLEEEFQLTIGVDEASLTMLNRFQLLEDYVRVKTATQKC